MFYPYCTIFDRIEVCHTPRNKNGCVLVHFEEPDAVYGFKTLEVTIPGYNISSRVGFSDDEVAFLIDFSMHNAGIIMNASIQGGVANAEYL